MSTILADPDVLSGRSKEAAKSIVTAVEKRFQLAAEAKRTWEIQAYINIAYFLGYQWLDWEDGTGLISTAEDPENRYHLVHNLVQGAVRTQVSRIISHRPWAKALPSTASDEDVEAARLGSKFLQHIRRKMFTQTMEIDHATWLVICGTAFRRVGWDALAGQRIVPRPLAPFGEAIASPHWGEETSQRPAETTKAAQLNRWVESRMEGPGSSGAGHRPFGGASEEVGAQVAEGDILLEVIDPFEVYPEPNVSDWDKCSWVIHSKVRSRNSVRDAWGDKVAKSAKGVAKHEINVPGFDPDKVPKTGEPYNLDSLYQSYRADNDNVMIIDYWERPSSMFPSGRRTLVVGGELVHDGPNPFPFNDIPLIHTPFERAPGTLWGRGLIETVRPAQDEYNRTLSQLAEARDYMSFPKIMTQKNSGLSPVLGDNLPGDVWEYNGAIPPTVLQPPSMPAYMATLLQQSYTVFMDLTHQHEVTKGTTPPNVEYGVAIQMLHEADNSPMRGSYDMIDDGISKAAFMMLMLAQKYYTEERSVHIVGADNEAQVIAFMGSQLRGIRDVYIESRSAVPDTLSGRREEIKGLYRDGILGNPGDPVTRQRVLAALEMGHLDELFENNMTVEEAIMQHLAEIVSQPGGLQQLMVMLQSMGAPVAGAPDAPQAQGPAAPAGALPEFGAPVMAAG